MGFRVHINRRSFLPIVYWILAGYCHAAQVPGISGRIIDAKTGKPLSRVPITRVVQTGLSAACGPLALIKQTPSRYFNDASNPRGGFSLGNLSFRLSSCTTYQGQILYVNFDENGVGIPGSRLIIPDPFKPQNLARNPQYFPVVINFNANGNTRQGLELQIFDGSEATISLIPIVDNLNSCESISDLHDRDSCQELNSYRLATVKHEPELCSAVRAQELRAVCEQMAKGSQ